MTDVLAHRPVEAPDIPAICGFPTSLEELSFLFPDTAFPLARGVLRDAIRDRRDSTVVLVDGEVAGFANFYEWEAGDYCSAGNVIVDPKQRGKGVARYLIETMIRLAADRYAAREVRLVCFNANAAGLLLYTGLGFVPYAIEERIGPDGKRRAAIRMKFVLAGQPLKA